MSAQAHITYRDRPIRRVLSVLPVKYDDMWTGAKGQVVIYAPHITG